MGSNFDRRMRDLEEDVGAGYLTARCVVDQAYAQDQHQTEHYRHLSGGRSHYLGGPLLERHMELMERLARNAITERGSNLRRGIVEVAENLSLYVLVNAPRDSGQLLNSGHPIAEDNGIEYYNRPPVAQREGDNGHANDSVQ